MGLITTINQFLLDDSELKNMLANSAIDETLPAIYDHWAPADTPTPYVNVIYEIGGSADHPYKRAGSLHIDIFVGNGDTKLAEDISRRVNKILLQKRYFKSIKDGRINIYKSTASGGIIPEDDPEIVHWNDVYDLSWWDLEIIK